MDRYLFYYIHERNINNQHGEVIFHEEVIFYRGLQWEPYNAKSNKVLTSTNLNTFTNENMFFTDLDQMVSAIISSEKVLLLGGNLVLIKLYKNGNYPDFTTNLKHLEERLQLEVIKQKPILIECIENPSEQVQFMAVNKNFNVISYIKNPTKKVKDEAERQRKIEWNNLGKIFGGYKK